VRIGRPFLAILTGALVSLAACSGAASAPAGRPVELTVYAASSLRNVMATVKPAYEAAHPGTTLVVATDSSAALETKIEQGAPADVFLSADTKNPTTLVDKGLAAGSPVPFARNLLTVIVPLDNRAGVTTPADLAKPGVKIIAAGDAAPITKYAAQLVTNLASQAGYPADFAAKYAANVVSHEDNVAAVVAKVELGEGDAGIVYVTDAKGSTKVTAIAVPDAANVPATYAGVAVKASAHAEAGAAFFAWMASPDGQAILVTFGFLAPS
jgi:molybdate transport system substrate-binding protein